MFEKPAENGGGYLSPGRYIVKVVKLEKVPSQTEGWKDSIRWYFHLVDCATGRLVERDGQPYEWYQFSSVSLSKHPKNKTRPWVEALLKIDVDDLDEAEVADLCNRLIGTKADVMIGVPTGSTRDGILTIKPYKEPAKVTKTAPVSAAVATLEDDLPESQRTSAVAVAEPEEEFAF
jgi:hypothetical protein